MEEGAAKRRNGDGGCSSAGRISRLPEPVLDHILSFLDQKSAVKTCVLSKSWRYIWCTRPKIQLHQGHTLVPVFLSLVDRILQGYHDRKLRLDEFSLSTSRGEVDRAADADVTSLLNKWIPIIIRSMGVKSFDLTAHLSSRTKSGLFEVPSVVFESDSIRNLSLGGCKVLKPTSMHYLKHLLTLRLSDINISKEVLDDILSNCPFIEDVSLVNCAFFNPSILRKCKSFRRIELLNNKPTRLKYLHFYDNLYRCMDVEIGDDIPTLRTIDISHCCVSVNRNQLLEFAHLVRLSMTRVRLSSKVFSWSLPCLEEFTLHCCTGIREFSLSSSSMIKCLDINNTNWHFKVTVDAPSIASFRYEGILPQSISFTAAATTSNDWKSKIILTTSSEHSHSLNELTGLLKALRQSEISLELNRIQIRRLCRQIQVQDNGNTNNSVGVSEANNLPVVVDHLTIKRPKENPRSCAAYFLNRLFRMFRPSFIRLDRDFFIVSKTELQEIIELVLKKRELVQCYFWQLDLEEVSLQISYEDQSEWQPVEYSSFTELSKIGAAGELGLHFKWGESS